MPKIFYDMDNTIALFSIKGREGESLEKMYEKDFFNNLKVIENSQLVLKLLVKIGHEVHILSACIDSEHCEKEKLEWLEKHFPFIKKENIHFLPVGQNKAEHIKNLGIEVKDSYLVDDYSKNLNEWSKYNGIPVKKRFSEKGGWNYIVRNHVDIFNIPEISL